MTLENLKPGDENKIIPNIVRLLIQKHVSFTWHKDMRGFRVVASYIDRDGYIRSGQGWGASQDEALLSLDHDLLYIEEREGS
jgi:hypothetical protein